MKRILFDTDIGIDVDDALALVLATRSPEVRLEAVTTVYGDVAMRARIARKLLNLAGVKGIPVAAGEGEPITSGRRSHRYSLEGQGIDLADESLEFGPQHGVDLIIEKVQASPHEITLLAIGPMTNLALALRRDPALARLIPHILIMGGTIDPIVVGGVNLPPESEHNLNADPEAAQVVLESGIPITLVPMNITLQVPLDDEHLRRIKAANTPLTDTLVELSLIWRDFVAREFRPRLGWPPEMVNVWLHDLLALAVAIDRSLLSLKPMRVRVEMRDGVLLTIPTAGPPNMEVCVGVDPRRFADFVTARIAGE